MKRSVQVSSLILGLLAGTPAGAQYGGMGGGGYGGFGDRPDYGGPMRPRREYVPAPDDGRRYRRDPYAGRPYHRQYGRMCVTSRGTCETGTRPAGSGCTCHVPGLGPKRGIVR